MVDFDPSTQKDERTDKFLEIKILIDGYKQKEPRISHWLQKDGGQNCWDARKNLKNKDKKWKCVFELHENISIKNDKTNKIEKKTFVTITDYGTYGLTGRVLSDKDLLTNLDLDERWGRFENYAFRNKLPKGANAKHLLGSRGRGKYVFIAASKMSAGGTKATLYETRRDDGVYRLGRRTVQKLKAQTIHADQTSNPTAEEVLKSHSGLSPIKHVGTRIIIPDPEDEVIDDFKDGTLRQFISETWWEIIQKYNAEFIVKVGGKEVT